MITNELCETGFSKIFFRKRKWIRLLVRLTFDGFVISEISQSVRDELEI